MDEYLVKPIAIARTPFNAKFGIPRQSGILNIPAVIDMLPPYNSADAVEGLACVSHIWLTFIFHQHLDAKASLKVRPPRLGGNKKIGVFATRSSFRPNAIGQSLVQLDKIESTHSSIKLHVNGIDLLDGTPIIDIKPYLPYAHSKPLAVNLLAADIPDLSKLDVTWQAECIDQLRHVKPLDYRLVQTWITQLIQLDPRPAYKSIDKKNEFSMTVFDVNLRWKMLSDNQADIFSVTLLE